MFRNSYRVRKEGEGRERGGEEKKRECDRDG